MSERVVILPGPAHPITTEANPARVVIRAGGRVIADSVLSLTLREASYLAVHYIPRTDIDMDALTRSTRGSYCPYKGEASYFSVAGSNGRIADVAWSYENPFPRDGRDQGLPRLLSRPRGQYHRAAGRPRRDAG